MPCICINCISLCIAVTILQVLIIYQAASTCNSIMTSVNVMVSYITNSRKWKWKCVFIIGVFNLCSCVQLDWNTYVIFVLISSIFRFCNFKGFDDSCNIKYILNAEQIYFYGFYGCIMHDIGAQWEYFGNNIA